MKKSKSIKIGPVVILGFILALAAILSVNIAQAARVSIGVGTSYGSNVVYIPGHWYHGYWVPGQYVEYAGPAPGSNYIWYEGSIGSNGHWHRGYWGHSHGHHHHH